MEKITFGIDVDDNGSPKLAKFEKNVDKASKGVKAFGASAGAAGVAMKGMMGFLAVGVIANYAKGVVDAAGANADFAQSIGATAKGVAGLGYAAKLGGSSMEGLQANLKKLAINMSDAVKKGDLGKFEKLGINIKDASGEMRNADEVMIELADTFANMENGTRKTALAVELFGKKGTEMIPVLNQGSDALRRQANEGAFLTGSLAGNQKAMEDFGDAIDTMQTAGQGLITFIVNSAGPIIERFSKGISQWAADLAERAAVAESIAQSEKQGRDADIKAAYRNKAVFDAMLKLNGKLKEADQDKSSRLAKQIEQYEKIGSLSTDQIRFNKVQAKLTAMTLIENSNGNKQDIFDLEEKNRLTEELAKLKGKLATPPKAKPKLEGEGEEPSNKFAKEIDQKKVVIDAFDEYLRKDEELRANAEASRIAWIQDKYENAGLKKAKDASAYAEQAKRDDEEENKRLQFIQDFKLEQVELEKKAQDELKEKNDLEHEESLKRIEEEKAKRLEMYSQIAGAATSLSGTISKINQIQINRLNDRTDKEIQQAENIANAQINSANGSEQRIAQINKELAEKKTAIEQKRQDDELGIKKKTFETEQNLSIVEAVMNGAVAATQAFASAPPPFGFALAALVAGSVAAEIGVIKSQKLAAGGAPIGQNAIVMMNEKGREEILNHEATKTAGSQFVSSLNSGASMKEALSVAGFGNRSSGNVTVNVAGFVDSPKTVEYIAKAVQKAVRAKR